MFWDQNWFNVPMHLPIDFGRKFLTVKLTEELLGISTIEPDLVNLGYILV